MQTPHQGSVAACRCTYSPPVYPCVWSFRYAMARLLQRQNLPFLAGFSLGRLCRVVQLAFLKGFLVFEKDGLLPPCLNLKPTKESQVILGAGGA